MKIFLRLKQYKESLMTTILRWHISRIYEEQERKKGASHIEVTISPGSEKIRALTEHSNTISKDNNYEEITDKKSDNLDWWQIGDEYQLEGWVTEKLLMNALKFKNVSSKVVAKGKNSEPRKIEEDMVFLQFIENEYALDSVWTKLNQSKHYPNLKGLVDIEESKWVDFTKKAREMAKNIYKSVLRPDKGEIK